MIPFNEFIRRSLAGPVMSEKDFDLHLSRTIRGLVLDYAIRFKPEELICDDATSDAIFQAAVDLLGRVGVYNMDTSRVILLTRDEALAVAEETPGECAIGGGADAVTIRARSHDSQAPPVVVACPVRCMRYREGFEKMFLDMAAAYSGEDSELGKLAGMLLAELDGIENLADTPSEMKWSRSLAKWSRAVAKAAGRPDMYLMNPAGISVPAILAAYGEGLLQGGNSSIPIHLMPELKLNWDRLKLAYAALEMGVSRWVSTNGVLGAYCRTGEELAIATVASLLAQLCYGHGDRAHVGSVDREGNRTRFNVIQAHSAACRALERNVGTPLGSVPLTKNGLGTAKGIYEEAAAVLGQTCSAVSWIWVFPCHPGAGGELRVDLDYMLVSKVSRGVAGLGREKAGELLEKILALYEPTWDVYEPGNPYPYYYDLKTLTPTQDLVDLYERAEDTLTRLGLPLADPVLP